MAICTVTRRKSGEDAEKCTLSRSHLKNKGLLSGMGSVCAETRRRPCASSTAAGSRAGCDSGQTGTRASKALPPRGRSLDFILVQGEVFGGS